MAKRYARLNWNSTTTYVSSENLNRMDKGIDDCDNAIEALNNNLVSFESSKSIITCKLRESTILDTESYRYYLPVSLFNLVGNSFSVNSDGNIVCNIEGDIKISANIKFLSTVFPKYYSVGLYKNNIFLTDSGVYSSGVITTGTISSFSTHVSKNDVIKLSAYIGAGANGAKLSELNSVFITVEDATNNSNMQADQITTKYTNKNISILGDSISTFVGYIPSGNANYYDGVKGNVATMSETWWGSVVTRLGAKLLINQSWSTSKISGTTEPSANLTRCTSLHNGEINPDFIFVYMGINDFNNNGILGTYNFNGDLPTTNTSFIEAYCVMLNKMIAKYPLAEIKLLTFPYSMMNTSAFPVRNANNETLKSYNNAIKQIGEMFCIEVIDISKCGINYKNLSTYCLDYDPATGKGLHPNKAGHKLIADYVLKHM